MSQLHGVDQHTRDRWHRRLPRQLSLNPAPLPSRGGVDNSTQGTMCCAPLKLVPRVKRTQGPSDGDTLIRDSQVFYHPVTLKQISFRGGLRCVHVGEYFQMDLCTGVMLCGCHWNNILEEHFLSIQLKCRKMLCQTGWIYNYHLTIF